jgi:TRAP-type uncharacterized transport system substrate-binding protein
MNTFGDLKEKKISIGKQKSGTAMTSYLLYKELFNENLQKAKTQPFNEALKELENGTIDAIIKVAGQPVERLSKNMSKNSAEYIKLLSYNEKNSLHKPIKNYYTADIKASNYKWVDSNIPTLSTMSYLITYNYTNGREQRYIKSFVKSLRNKLQNLKQEATKDSETPHLKWKEVPTKCTPILPGGWKYYRVVYDVCNNSSISEQETCSKRDKDLGLCN